MVRPRGRPPKFGRPGRLVALTLPEDALAWLRTIDRDPARAIVNLFEGAGGHEGGPVAVAPPRVEIAILAGRRGLIVVDRQMFSGLPGIDLLPLDGTRAFLALRDGAGLSDLELAVVDRMEDLPDGLEREALTEFRRQLRQWRRDPAWRFEGRSIIVAERRPRATKRRPAGGGR